MTGMEKFNEYFKSHHGEKRILAHKLGLAPSTLTQWKAVPVEYLPEVSAFTGIPREELLPDAFREAKEMADEKEAG